MCKNMALRNCLEIRTSSPAEVAIISQGVHTIIAIIQRQSITTMLRYFLSMLSLEMIVIQCAHIQIVQVVLAFTMMV